MRFLIVFFSVFLICVEGFSHCEEDYAKHSAYGCHRHNHDFTNTTPAPYPDGEGVVHHVHNEPESENPHEEKTASEQIMAGGNINAGEVNQPTPTLTPPPSGPAPPSEPTGGGNTIDVPPSGPAPPSEPTGGGNTIDVPHVVETRIIFPPSVPPSPEPVELSPQPLLVTEYMMRDGGFERLPTWIELYNPSEREVSLDDWTFTWVTRKFVGLPYDRHVAVIKDFVIPAKTVVILASKTTTRFAGIKEDQVYDLGIPCGRCLKQGWQIANRDKKEIYATGSVFGKPPPLKRGSWKERESWQVYKHENPKNHYYGRSNDIGSPGFYEQPVPQAPSAVGMIHVGIWAALKRR